MREREREKERERERERERLNVYFFHKHSNVMSEITVLPTGSFCQVVCECRAMATLLLGMQVLSWPRLKTLINVNPSENQPRERERERKRERERFQLWL